MNVLWKSVFHVYRKSLDLWKIMLQIVNSI